MDLKMLFIPRDLSTWDVTRSVAAIIHSDEFSPRQQDPTKVDRPINFRVTLGESKAGGVGNDGTGILTLPTESIGSRFLKWVKDLPLKIEGSKIKVYKQNLTDKGVVLDKTPYINPDLEEEHQNKLWGLRDQFRVNVVQFGVFYRSKYPSNASESLVPRSFSVEWERRCITETLAWLSFEYDHKIFRIKMGNEMVEKTGQQIAINFACIQKMAVGYSGDAYICFDLLTPPLFEELDFHRATTGDKNIDERKSIRRIGSLHPGHEVVAAYARHLRIVLYRDPVVDVVLKFINMCKTAGIPQSTIIHCQGRNQIEADRQGFFNQKIRYQLDCRFKVLPWPVAFQLESLLYNGLLHTSDLFKILPKIESSLKKGENSIRVSELLRKFHEELEVHSLRESPLACFFRVQDTYSDSYSRITPTSGAFYCSHVTFTPTRKILEGPYATQSNRVIRKYDGYEDNFIRVDFRDEDRLQYRWSFQVDGTSYLNDRVGGILKNGFDLAGRHFQFLAYSNSSLREHAVWFMTSFNHEKYGFVHPDGVRKSLGIFEGTDLLKKPSKYAARLAQAFTSTDPSVKISRKQWEKVEDLGNEPYLFTDGVGTISKELGDKIWGALCTFGRDHRATKIQPSAYQIRFLGYKGVVAVDKQLEGVFMRLRKSMCKFESEEIDESEIEIAQSFEHPNTCYLNRSLVMLLEDQGVRHEVFQELQEMAVADARTIHDSYSDFRNILERHSLGTSYHLSSLLKRFASLGLDLEPKNRIPGFDTSFLRRVREVSMMDVLRDIKHNARIPIPESYLLVGIADEGPVYRSAGMEDFYVLPENRIFACVQKSMDSEPVWLKGNCTISRSPVAHPGDVQRVIAIGRPPEAQRCFFKDLKNVVVLPSVGKRSLASCLGGGDVDGDLFAIICYEPLLPALFDEPASYEAGATRTLDSDSTVNDICDFIVEYIISDVIGLLSDRLLVIADQSKEGMRDPDCLKIAQLCSQAVDYPKQGIAVNISKLPHPLIRCKPDWHAAEIVSPRKTDYYESSRALGIMYRAIHLDDPNLMPELHKAKRGLSPPLDPVSTNIMPRIIKLLGMLPQNDIGRVSRIFSRYVNELRYICATHTISNTPGIRLLEEEVVAGTILAKCSQKRWRKDRMYRMRLHASTLVKDIRHQYVDDFQKEKQSQLIKLGLAWQGWVLSLQEGNEFGANSFGLISLLIIFDCLDELERPEPLKVEEIVFDIDPYD